MAQKMSCTMICCSKPFLVDIVLLFGAPAGLGRVLTFPFSLHLLLQALPPRLVHIAHITVEAQSFSAHARGQ